MKLIIFIVFILSMFLFIALLFRAKFLSVQLEARPVLKKQAILVRKLHRTWVAIKIIPYITVLLAVINSLL